MLPTFQKLRSQPAAASLGRVWSRLRKKSLAQEQHTGRPSDTPPDPVPGSPPPGFSCSGRFLLSASFFLLRALLLHEAEKESAERVASLGPSQGVTGDGAGTGTRLGKTADPRGDDRAGLGSCFGPWLVGLNPACSLSPSLSDGPSDGPSVCWASDPFLQVRLPTCWWTSGPPPTCCTPLPPPHPLSISEGGLPAVLGKAHSGCIPLQPLRQVSQATAGRPWRPPHVDRPNPGAPKLPSVGVSPLLPLVQVRDSSEERRRGWHPLFISDCLPGHQSITSSGTYSWIYSWHHFRDIFLAFKQLPALLFPPVVA